jgi:4-diphosphocytidyl-2-C-methyl-D-erythritol kinase
MSRARANAKINLALVVGPLREDGKHEVATVLQRIDLHDDVELEPADSLEVRGFAEDTLVTGALERLAAAAGVSPCWRVSIGKRIPVAAGLGGGSSDAAAALLLANAALARPLAAEGLHRLAAELGADVPFFLDEGAQLATEDGSMLRPLALPLGYHVLLVLPHDSVKESTRVVYERFDEREGADGFDDRRDALIAALAAVRESRDLGSLPRNDLVSSMLAGRLEELGAFRADVSGAGPAVYGLFENAALAARAGKDARPLGQTWLTHPV